jgi:hypothetical protein
MRLAPVGLSALSQEYPRYGLDVLVALFGHGWSFETALGPVSPQDAMMITEALSVLMPSP